MHAPNSISVFSSDFARADACLRLMLLRACLSEKASDNFCQASEKPVLESLTGLLKKSLH
jgi:hypothetical protein